MPAPTRALILAAGIGRRLGADGTPKALLRFGNESLIARHLRLLHGAGVEDVTLVLGHQAERIEQELDRIDLPRPTLIRNPDYREGSVVSLHAGQAVLRGGAAILMDADVIYDRRLMARLVDSPLPNVLLLDRELEPGDEPVKLCVAGNRIVDFRKRPEAAHDWHGESVGFFRFAPDAAAELAARAEGYVAAGRRDTEYEEPIRDMIIASPPNRFGYEDVTGLPWTEIDFPEDVEKARGLIPLLAA